MATNHVQEGNVMTWTNGTGIDVASGDVVKVGDMVCVALADIADGETGELTTEEVWELPKEAALAIGQGVKVYWDDAAGEIDTTDTNTLAGRAFVAAAAADSTVKVKLGR